MVEYRGKLMTQQEADICTKQYKESEKVFVFDFKWNGKMWW